MTTLNFRSLDLNLLRVFDEVMAERSLTRAAHKPSERLRSAPTQGHSIRHGDH